MVSTKEVWRWSEFERFVVFGTIRLKGEVINIPGWYAIEIQDIRAKAQYGVWLYRHAGREVVIDEM